MASSTYVIDGLTYTDKLPHSRIERILYKILNKIGGGGGGGGETLVVDDPSDLGNGLSLSGNAITVHATNTMNDSSLPITSGAVHDQINLADTALGRI